jgi:hypothetical protein
VPDWSYFYPYHYAPFASDLRAVNSAELRFVKGHPLPPIGQLLAVLPAASSQCMPEACRELMTSPDSPIADFYPTDFKLDPAGKPAELRWLWVVLLPFIDEARLHEALKAASAKFDANETRRNREKLPELLIGPKHASTDSFVTALEPRPSSGPRWIPVPATTSKTVLPLLGKIRALTIATPPADAPLGTTPMRAATRVLYEPPPLPHHYECALLESAVMDPQVTLSSTSVANTASRKRARLPVNDYALGKVLESHERGGQDRRRGTERPPHAPASQPPPPASAAVAGPVEPVASAAVPMQQLPLPPALARRQAQVLAEHERDERVERARSAATSGPSGRGGRIPCKFFAQGRCNKGMECTFAHELMQMPETSGFCGPAGVPNGRGSSGGRGRGSRGRGGYRGRGRSDGPPSSGQSPGVRE